MVLSIGIIFAALGITTLEMVEASAVGLTLYHSSKKIAVYGALVAGSAVVLIPTFLVGKAVSLLPVFDVRLMAALLLLYFGLRLAKSARRSIILSRTGSSHPVEESHRSLIMAAFSVGAVEALEAAVVLVALIPISLESASIGFGSGVIVVLISTLLLQSQVRKVKQAAMKMVVSALLLSFSAFWGVESVLSVNDLLLVPFFAFFVIAVYFYSHHSLPSTASKM